MRFNIDSDEGNVLRLWLTLDNPSDVPSLAVWAGGERVAELGANTFRPDVRDHGLHATGEAGFTLDESSLSGITGMQDLELRELTSGIPVYARFQPDRQQRRKVLVWSRPSLMSLDSWVDRTQFSLVYPNIDTMSLETAGAVLDSSRAQSMVAIGRPNLLRFSELLDRQGFEVNFVLTDPYVDLAERLIILLGQNPDAQPALKRMVTSLHGTNLEDHRSLVRFFRTFERNEMFVLRSPMVRALTKAPEEDVRRQDVSVALKVLSRHKLVCTEQSLHLFTDAVQQLSSLDPDVLRLAERVRQIEAVSDLLNEDIALYRYVGLAVAVAHDANAGGVKP